MTQISRTKRTLSLTVLALVALAFGSGGTGHAPSRNVALANAVQAASPVSGSCAPPGCGQLHAPAPPASNGPRAATSAVNPDEHTMLASAASRPEPVVADALPQTITIDGHTYRVVRHLKMVASAYGSGEPGVGNWTFSGSRARVGEVAVDPRVVPLGTMMYIRGYKTPYLPQGGLLARAEDTGGAIKGDRVDIFMEAPLHAFAEF